MTCRRWISIIEEGYRTVEVDKTISGEAVSNDLGKLVKGRWSERKKKG